MSEPKRIVLGWNRNGEATEHFKPLEFIAWMLSNSDLPQARQQMRKAELEEVAYTEEGAGMGTSFSTIAEAIAYADFRGDVIVNREDALAEQARRRGWLRPGQPLAGKGAP